MRRSVVVVAAVAAAAVLVVGSATAAFAAPPGPWGSGWGCPGWGFGGAYGYGGDYSDPTLDVLASKLGVSAKDLVADLQSGKSVIDVAKAKSVSEQTLVDALLAPDVDSLNLRVKYGYLTQQQADYLTQVTTDRIKYQLNQKGYSGGFGSSPGYGPGWGRGMMGRSFGFGFRGFGY